MNLVVCLENTWFCIKNSCKSHLKKTEDTHTHLEDFFLLSTHCSFNLIRQEDVSSSESSGSSGFSHPLNNLNIFFKQNLKCILWLLDVRCWIFNTHAVEMWMKQTCALYLGSFDRTICQGAYPCRCHLGVFATSDIHHIEPSSGLDASFTFMKKTMVICECSEWTGLRQYFYCFGCWSNLYLRDILYRYCTVETIFKTNSFPILF